MHAIPSLWLRSFAAFTHWALWGLLGAWTVLALAWGALHFLIVPRIGDFRPLIEKQASQRLGISVRIGDIVARSNGLIPSIELRDVQLIDGTGREALRLPSVLAALSPRSALGRGFEQVYVEGPELSVRRSADGRFWIAGFAIPERASADTSGMDWLFSQTELAVRHGKVRWTDELRNMPPLELSDVDVVLRNKRQSHALRIDADPPAGWGTRLSLQAQFKQPLFSRHNGDWRSWSGQLFAEGPQIDLAQLRNYVDLGVDVSRGAGSARAWVDVDQGRVTGATADVALQAVTVKVAAELEPLDLTHVSGRLGGRARAGGVEFSTQSLAFETRDGVLWPGGNVQASLWDARDARPARGALSADRLDLAALSEIAGRLPLDVAVRDALKRLAPRGLVETLQLEWQGSSAAPDTFAAKGQVSGLELAAQPQQTLGVPGVRGARIDFDLTQSGGKASVSVQNGQLEFPGLLDNPVVPLNTLSADLQWKQDGQHTTLDSGKLQFANADAQGEARIQWHSKAVPKGSDPGMRLPGVLDLQGSLSRLNLAALPRYLPLPMNRDARDYLAQALLAGEGSNLRFRVKGELDKFPFASAKEGELHISGDFKDASFLYAPPRLLPRDSAPWPTLTQLAGALVLDHDRLQLKSVKGLVAPGSSLALSKTEVAISQLFDAPIVNIAAEARGPLAEALAFVNTTPIGSWTERALAQTTVSGTADYKVRLVLPLEQLDKSTAQGSVALSNSDFQFNPLVPRLSRIKGALAFTDTGFSVSALQARALGGDVRIDGGLNFSTAASARNAPGTLRMQGTASTEGLRQAAELGLVARLAQFATGATAYTATLGLRAGQPELLVNSNLAGLALYLPAPFAKPAEALLPLRLEGAVLRESQQAGARLQDQWQLELGKLVRATLVRDVSGTQAKLLRGAVGVGLAANESAVLPASGVSANVNLAEVDVDVWTAVVATLMGVPAGGNLASLGSGVDGDYLPNAIALRANALVLEGRTFNNLLLGGARDGKTWKANVEATELGGYLEYRQSSASAPGRVYARLARLTLAPAVAQDVENILDQQPASIPALDIVVDDLELRNKKLGRLELQAVNMGGGAAREGAREWRLNKFNITVPEASFTALGNWVNVNAQAGDSERSLRERRRTVLNFKLEVADSGELLKRLGMPGVIAKGRGKVDGQVSWLGSPLNPDYPSMGGGFRIDMESGQFLKADPGIAKLLGVLSLQSLPRRLALDFRDVFSDGFAFDFVRGDATIEQGIARTNNLQMKGVNAAVMMEGKADIAKETQLLKVVVVPEINVAGASLLYSAINPVVGLTTFLANLLLRGPLVNANTQEFLIDGTWVDPRVTKVDRNAAPAATPAPAAK